MKNQQTQWKRRNYLVNPGFQLRFMFYVACGVLTGFAVIYITNLWYLNMLVEQGRELGLDPGSVYFEFVDHQRKLMNIAFLVVCTTVFAVLMVAGLLLSHKIAGPVYRVQKYTREVIAGEEPPGPVSLRKGDFFPELATIVNDLVAHASKEAEVVPEEDPNGCMASLRSSTRQPSQASGPAASRPATAQPVGVTPGCEK